MDVPDESGKSSRPTNLSEHHVSSPSEHIIPQMVITSADDVSDGQRNITECTSVLIPPSNGHSNNKDTSAGFTESANSVQEERPVDDFEDISVVVRDVVSRCTESVSHSVRQRPLVMEVEKNVQTQEASKDSTSITCPPPPPPVTVPCAVISPPPPPVLLPLNVNEPQPSSPSITPSPTPASVCSPPSAMQRPLVFEGAVSKSEPALELKKDTSLEESTEIKGKLICDKIVQEIQHTSEVPIEEARISEECTTPKKEGLHGVKKFFDSLWNPEAQEAINLSESGTSKECNVSSDVPTSGKRIKRISQSSKDSKSDLTPSLEPPCEIKESTSFAKDAKQNIKSFFDSLKHETSEVKDSSKRQSKEFESEKTIPDSPKESTSFAKDTKKNIKALFDTFKAEPSDQKKTSPVDVSSEIHSDKNLSPSPESPKESTSFTKDAKGNIKAFFDTFKHDSSEQKHKSDMSKKSLSQPNVCQEADNENILHPVTIECTKEPKESKSLSKDSKQNIKVKSGSTKKSLSQPDVDKDFNAEANLQSFEPVSPKESSFVKDTKQNIKSFFDTFKHESNDSKQKKDVCKKSASQPDFTRDSKEIDSTLPQATVSPKEKESVSFAKEAKQNVKAFFDTFKHETHTSKSEDSQRKDADSQPPMLVLNKDSEIHKPAELNKESVSVAKDTKQGNKSIFGSFKHESGDIKTKSDSSKKPTASEPDLHREPVNEKVMHQKDTKNPIKKFFSFKHIGEEGETMSPELSGSLDSQLPKESAKTAPLKIAKSVRLDLQPTYSNGAENISSSYTHMNGHETELVSNIKERAQSVPSDAFRKSENFVLTDVKKSEGSSVASLDSPPGNLGEHKEGRHSIKKFFDSFKHEKTCTEKDSSPVSTSKKESSKELSAIDLASATGSERPVKEKKNKSIKRSLSDKLNREEVIQNFKGFFDSVSHKAPSKKPAQDSEHIYDVVEVKSEIDSPRSVILKTEKSDAKSKGPAKSDTKGLKKVLSSFHHKDASKSGSESINVTQSKSDKITEESVKKGQESQKTSESTKLSSYSVSKNLKNEAVSESPTTAVNEPGSPKPDRTSVFNAIGENILALKDKMLHSKEKRKSDLIDDSIKVTDLSAKTDKIEIEMSQKAALPSTSKESKIENVVTTKPVPSEKPKLIAPEKPKLIAPEKLKSIPPEKPKSIPPEKPKLIPPEKPKLIPPEKPRLIEEAAKPTNPQAINKSEPLKEAFNEKPSTLYDTCCMKIAILLRDKALDIVDRTKSPPPKPPKPSAETIAKARAAAVSRRLADAQKKGHSVGECFPIHCDGMRFVDDDTESSCDYKDVENFDYIMDYELINRYKLDNNKLDTFSLPSTCSGLTSYYTADTVTSRDEIYSDAVMETVSLSSDISYNLNKFSSSKSKPKVYPGDVKGRKEAAATKQSTPKKPPPPIPPKPIISKIKEKTDDKTVSQCVNGLSLSPRLQNKISKDPVATQKRPLMVADVKGTQFSSLQHPKKNAPQKPARNFDTILKNESLKKVPYVSLDSISAAAEETVKSDNLSKSTIKVEKRTISPPRPPPPNIAKKPEKLPKPERPPPPIKSPKSLPVADKVENKVELVVDEVNKITDAKHFDEVQNLCIVADNREKDEDSFLTDSTLLIDKDKSENILVSHSVVDTEKSQSIEIIGDDSYQHNLKIEQDNLNNNIEPNKALTDSLNNNIEAYKGVPIENPKPPPRNKRIRSRTVEVVPAEKQEDRLKRSQSLSEMDVQKRVTFLDAEKAKVDSKSLYTTVNKNGKKSNSEKTSQSSPDLSFRPLPAPPPPPRRFRSLERRTKPKSNEQNDDKFIKIHELSVSPAPSDDSIKAPSRRRKTDKQRFLSLHGEQRKEIDMVSDNFKRAESVPSRPDRKLKSSMTTKYDVNANISSVTSSQDSLFTSKNIPDADTIDSVDKSKSKRDADSRKRSLSNWYDEQDQGSWEVIDMSHDLTEEFKQSPKVPQRHKQETKRKSRETSKFYVNVDEEATTLSVDEASSPLPYIYKPVSPVPLVDKETSPLPLDCSEKSVQTSLETLSQGIASRDEQSDDTDELLDLAQTLQKELSVIIKRHKSVNESTEDTPSPPLSAATSEKNLAQDFKEIKKSSSVRSSTSEVWPITSSDESDVDRVGEESSNINEVAVKRKQKKIFYIAREIMTSEEAFVDALKLLNVDFKSAVETANRQRNMTIIPEDNLAQILNHLPQLQHLNENLLMELKDRIENWDKHEKIADIIVKMGPFLKLYSWYIHDFESNVSLLEECKKKFPAFSHAVKEFEASARCKRLTLNHYMLKPIQRIPQYRLLLQEYFHHLSENSKDYQDTVTALQIVSEVANHANDSMKHGDNAQKLISIQNSIMGHKEIVKPGRIFVKEGELMKLSRKGMQPRWFVLFNDLLLYLTPVQQGLYRVNHELPLTGMKVAIPIQQDYQNEFSIISVTRSFTLAARSPEERQEWIIALTKAIEENASKRSTFTNSRLNQKAQDKTSSEDEAAFVLGKKAPVWIPDARVTMCQLCTSEFTVTFRRHHCRACGKVVCSICSSHRISLPYLGNRIARVCDDCHTHLGQGSSACTESGETDSENQEIAIKPHLRTDNRHVKKNKRMLPSVLKEVCANDQGSSISGYLYKRTAKSWKRDWFVVKDKVLYEYKASEDVAALRSIPLLGYQIELFDEACDGVDSSLLFQLTHPGQAPIVFYADTIGSAERWVSALKTATVL